MASADFSNNNGTNDNNFGFDTYSTSATTTTANNGPAGTNTDSSYDDQRGLLYNTAAAAAATTTPTDAVMQVAAAAALESNYYYPQHHYNNNSPADYYHHPQSEREQTQQGITAVYNYLNAYQHQQQPHHHSYHHQHYHHQPQQHQGLQHYSSKYNEDTLPPSNNSNTVTPRNNKHIVDNAAIVQPPTKRQKTTSASNNNNNNNSRKVNNEQWDAMLERLKAYKAKYGDCLVPKRFADDPKLGTWVETQRVQYKRLEKEYDSYNGQEGVTPNKRLNQERLEKLRAVGFAWSAKNVKRSSSSKTSVSSTNDSIISNDTTAAKSDVKVSVCEVPVVKKKSTAADASTALVDTSSSIGRNRRLNEAQWNEMYLRLRDFKEKHGHCVVPRKYADDLKLSHWVETQRVLWHRDYRNANNGLDEDDDQNKSLGGNNAINQSSTGQLPYGEDEVQDKQVQRDFSWDNYAAENYVDPQFIATRSVDDSQLVAKRLAARGRIGTERSGSEAGVTTTSEYGTEWYENAIQEDVDKLSNELASEAAAVAKISDANPKRLTQERKDKLDALGFVWSLRSKRIEDHWDQMFNHLLAYKRENGDCLVPSRYELEVYDESNRTSKCIKLGKWVETQRYEYTKLQRVSSADAATAGSDSMKANKNKVLSPRLTEVRRRRLEEIGFEWKVKNKMKRYYDKQWDQMFERLLEFRRVHGHCMVPKRYNEDVKLGTWVHTQRIQYRKQQPGLSEKDGTFSKDGDDSTHCSGNVEETGKTDDEVSYRLTDDRRRRLESVGFAWSARDNEKSVDPMVKVTRTSYDDQWDSMFERLRLYKQEHGDCLVPKRYGKDLKLGTWVDTQRVQYRKIKKLPSLESPDARQNGRQDDVDEGSDYAVDPLNAANKISVGRLTDGRIKRLEDLGFVWSIRDDWFTHYEELKQYRARFGNCNVPARYIENRRLGIWVSAQRQQYKILQLPSDQRPRRTISLTQERIELLNRIGFTWTIRSRDTLGESWTQRIEELKEFKRKHGHCLVPSRYPACQELATWVGTQRSQYKLYTRAKEQGHPATHLIASINEERITQLTNMGFVWNIRNKEPASARCKI